MKPGITVRRIIVVLVGFVGAVSLVAVGANNQTITTSFSSQSGAINAIYVAFEDLIGPGVVNVGTLSGCTLVPPPSLANCSPAGGSGTVNDPYQCSPTTLVFAGCSGGQPFIVLAGTVNLNTHVHTVTAVAPVVTAQSVPLSPWVPLASVAGVLLVILLRRRDATRG